MTRWVSAAATSHPALASSSGMTAMLPELIVGRFGRKRTARAVIALIDKIHFGMNLNSA